MDLKEAWCKGVDGIHLNQDRVILWDLENKAGYFITT
jgi:hypothetical protein